MAALPTSTASPERADSHGTRCGRSFCPVSRQLTLQRRTQRERSAPPRVPRATRVVPNPLVLVRSAPPLVDAVCTRRMFDGTPGACRDRLVTSLSSAGAARSAHCAGGNAVKASWLHPRLALALLATFLFVLAASSTASASGTGPNFASWSAGTTAPRTSDIITFGGAGADPDGGNIASYQWDFNGDGIYDTAALPNADVTHQFTSPGTYNVILKVTDDDDGLSYASHVQQITVKGNWAPEFATVAAEGTSQYPRTGQEVTFDFYAYDPDGGPGNVANANLDWKIDWNGDGSVDQTVPATD